MCHQNTVCRERLTELEAGNYANILKFKLIITFMETKHRTDPAVYVKVTMKTNRRCHTEQWKS